MAKSSWGTFAKTTLIPLFIALSFYVLVFIIILPLYRRYRSGIARYSNYTPLSSSLTHRTTNLFEPYLIQPSKSLVEKMREWAVRGLRWLLVPSDWARRIEERRRGEEEEEDDDDDGGGLFDAESGEAMVGFNDLEQRRGTMRGESEVDVDDSNRRLSRELEEGFRDDSASEASDEEVTVGRRTVSRRASEVYR